jgi:hypothetical protein
MKTSSKLVATALATALATSTLATPSFAVPKVKAPVITHSSGISKAAPWLLGCIFGSALGLISAAYLKKTGQLTAQEANAIAFSCGLGYFAVVRNFRP